MRFRDDGLELKIVSLVTSHSGNILRPLTTELVDYCVKNKSVERYRFLFGLFACSKSHTSPHGQPIFHQFDCKNSDELFGWRWKTEEVGTGRGVDMKGEGNISYFCKGDEISFLYGFLDE